MSSSTESIQEQIDESLPPNIDPSISFGYEITYDKELSLEFRNPQNEESENKFVRVRVLVSKENKVLKEVKLEVMDDGKLFFLVESVFTEETFKTMSEEHELRISFDGFPVEIANMLDQSLSTNEESYTVTFVENNDNTFTMNFLQMTEFKAVEIFSLNFVPSNDDLIQLHAQYRYTQMFNQLQLKKKMLQEFKSQMESKNPTLLKTMNSSRTATRKSMK